MAAHELPRLHAFEIERRSGEPALGNSGRTRRKDTKSDDVGGSNSSRLPFARARSVFGLDEAFRHGLHDLLHASTFLHAVSLTDGPAATTVSFRTPPGTSRRYRKRTHHVPSEMSVKVPTAQFDATNMPARGRRGFASGEGQRWHDMTGE